MIRLICFLGNPGREYSLTRHNLPWILLHRIIPENSGGWQKKFKGEFRKAIIGGTDTTVLKPLCYMNRSGESVRTCMAFFKIAPDELLTVHDDVELAFGESREKFGGGLGGHNGLKSIRGSLGTPDFYRLRMGISRPSRGSVSSYVLSRFTMEEEILLDPFLEKAAAALKAMIGAE